MSASTRNILTNKGVISVGQDLLGIQASRWMVYKNLGIWFKPLQKGEIAVCFLNRGNELKSFDFDLKQRIPDHDFGRKNYIIDANYQIKNLWNHNNIGTTAKKLKAKLPGHDVLMIRLCKL